MIQSKYYQFDSWRMGLVACSLSSMSSLSFFLPLIPPMQQEKLWYYVKRCMDWIVGFISLNSNGFFIWPLLQRVVLKENKINKPMKKKSKDDSFTNRSKIRLLSFRAWGNSDQSEWAFLSGKEREQSGSAGVNLTGLRIALKEFGHSILSYLNQVHWNYL